MSDAINQMFKDTDKVFMEPIPKVVAENLKNNMSDGLFQLTDAQRERIERLAEEQMPPEMKNLLEKAKAFINKVKSGNMTGVEKIAEKRLDQKIKHGHSVKKDYEAYPDFELIDAAKATIDGDASKFPETWDKDAAKRICAKSLEERLVTAGAMLAAQIDVLNYKE